MIDQWLLKYKKEQITEITYSFIYHQLLLIYFKVYWK